jgi:hypothetical protein
VASLVRGRAADDDEKADARAGERVSSDLSRSTSVATLR